MILIIISFVQTSKLAYNISTGYAYGFTSETPPDLSGEPRDPPSGLSGESHFTNDYKRRKKIEDGTLDLSAYHPHLHSDRSTKGDTNLQKIKQCPPILPYQLYFSI